MVSQLIRFIIGAVLLPAAVSGCAFRPPLLPGVSGQDARPAAVELKRVPHFPYKSGQCGPAALAAVLTASGVPVSPEALSGMVYLPGRKGSLQPEIIAACRRNGRIPYRIALELGDIIGELRCGRPVLVLTNLGLSVFPVWHYAVVAGYDLDRDALILRSADNPREVVGSRLFLRTWKRAGCWGIVALRPGELPASPDPRAYLEAVAGMEAIGMVEPARDGYECALRAWPDEPVALFGLGNTAYAAGDFPAAEAAFRRLVRLQPDNLAAVNNLAILLAEHGNREEALRRVSAALAAGSADTSFRTELLRTRERLLDQVGFDTSE